MIKQNIFFFYKCIQINTPLHKYSAPSLSTLFNNLMAEITASGLLGYDTTCLAHLCLGSFSHFFSADPLKLCQVGWGVFLHSYFQVSPEMFDRVQVWALAGPLKDIQRLVLKPLLHCLGWMLRVVVLLKGEPSLQSEVMSALEQVFIKDLSLFFAPFIFALILTSLPQSMPVKNISTA